MRSVRYLAITTPARRVKVAARQRGWKPGGDMSPSDWVEPADVEEVKEFGDLNQAIAHVLLFVQSGRSWFGVEAVLKSELYPDPDRIYRWHTTQKWTVTEQGVETNEVLS